MSKQMTKVEFAAWLTNYLNRKPVENSETSVLRDPKFLEDLFVKQQSDADLPESARQSDAEAAVAERLPYRTLLIRRAKKRE